MALNLPGTLKGTMLSWNGSFLETMYHISGYHDTLLMNAPSFWGIVSQIVIAEPVLQHSCNNTIKRSNINRWLFTNYTLH